MKHQIMMSPTTTTQILFHFIITIYLLQTISITKSSKIPTPPSSDKPNIVILFADNLGYNDISLFGAPTAKTPNIDSLGRDGLKLNNWNSAAHLCSASRAALLTGKQPVRTGIYPRVFKPGAKYGLLPNETTIAEHLKEEGYATSIVGKWHLGHRKPYLPTNQGFDEWIGIPYHMSGGSVDDHECVWDGNKTVWLPLYQDEKIVEQPVQLDGLARRYAASSTEFIQKNVLTSTPFLLYMAFSHVHQLCAPKFGNEQESCQWSSKEFRDDNHKDSFVSAVEEMDWIAGKILNTITDANISNNTLVIFTSDNGPWVAEQECAGSKGPFEGRWLQEHVAQSCTSCPHDYVPSPTSDRPRRCVSSHPPKMQQMTVEGVHCGADTGLGSVWEANLRMPALAKWEGHIEAGTETLDMVSTLDVLPTILSLIGKDIPEGLDGEDISNVLLGKLDEPKHKEEERVLFFWRDGFQDGPLPPPYGRYDVVAAKLGRIKLWFSTKSAHYNDDVEQYHDPPLLFDVLADPAEAFPLDPNDYQREIEYVMGRMEEHKNSVDWTFPLALESDLKFIPCVDETTSCRTALKPSEWPMTPEVSRKRLR